MRTLLSWCLLISLVCGAEQVREWTDIKGRKLTGTLVGKDDLNAEVLLKGGRKAKLPLKNLSKEDQAYVAEADVHPDPILEVRTSKATGDGGKYDFDIRAIEVTLEEMHERSYKVVVIWLGRDGSKTGIFLSEEAPISENVVRKKFDVTYDWKSHADNDYARDYSGYAVGLLKEAEGGGHWVAKAVSMKPYTRFLDQYLAERK
ncbi:hypothetical protein [Haloferula sp.]|uniref:hypothetical protein n=1 Tax=Haloferula sp. TaxID=2497595 RepID=UPI00329B113A